MYNLIFMNTVCAIDFSSTLKVDCFGLFCRYSELIYFVLPLPCTTQRRTIDLHSQDLTYDARVISIRLSIIPSGSTRILDTERLRLTQNSAL